MKIDDIEKLMDEGKVVGIAPDGTVTTSDRKACPTIDQVLAEVGDAHNAAAVPLHELLRHVPADHRLLLEDRDSDGRLMGSRSIPVGKHCHQAADMLARYETTLREITQLHLGGIEFDRAAAWAAVATARKALALPPMGHLGVPAADEQEDA